MSDRATMRFIAGVTVAGMAACGGNDGPSRAEVMGDVATEVVVPALEALAADAATVVTDVEAACAAPDEATVDTALASVDATRARWLATQAIWFGPAMERRAPTIMDWSVDMAGIDALVASDVAITEEVITGQVGSDDRGLRALRGVLASDDAAAVLTDDRWCDYVTSVAAAVSSMADAVLADWTVSFDGGPPFGDVVADPDQAQAWLSMLVNDDIFVARLVSGEVRQEGDVPPPDPAADRAAQLGGVAGVVNALGPLLGDELADRLDDEVAAAVSAFSSGDVEGGRTAAAEVDKTLTTDVAGRLDVTIGFSDADGDGSG